MGADNTRVGKRFAMNLRSARRRGKLSQERLGELAQLHRTEIGLLELGERVPRIDTLLRLVKPLAASPSELLRGIEWDVADAQFRIVEDRDEGRKVRWSLDFGTGLEAGLLERVIDLHPTHLPARRWVVETTAKKSRPGEVRAIEAAIQRLIASDLLCDNGEIIVPTRAAVRYSELSR